MVSIPTELGTVLLALLVAFGSQKAGQGEVADLATSGGLAVAGLGILYVSATAGD